MTAGEAVAAVDELKPNPYGQRDKLRWLSTLDGKITEELLSWHEGAPEEPFEGYGPDGMERELVAAAPYDELYPLYLMAQIDFHNNEMERYNNSMVMYNMKYAEYANYINRTRMPLQRNDMRTSL